MNITIITFANSEGCISIGPKSNHLLTPNLGWVVSKTDKDKNARKNKIFE
jgi:hypothetical protein